MTRCRHKDKHLLAKWVGCGHLPNQGGQSGGIREEMDRLKVEGVVDLLCKEVRRLEMM